MKDLQEAIRIGKEIAETCFDDDEITDRSESRNAIQLLISTAQKVVEAKGVPEKRNDSIAYPDGLDPDGNPYIHREQIDKEAVGYNQAIDDMTPYITKLQLELEEARKENTTLETIIGQMLPKDWDKKDISDYVVTSEEYERVRDERDKFQQEISRLKKRELGECQHDWSECIGPYRKCKKCFELQRTDTSLGKKP